MSKKKQKLPTPLLIQLVEAPDLNELFLSCFDFPETWGFRQVCHTLCVDIPSQTVEVQMSKHFLSQKFPKARRITLRDIDQKDQLCISKDQFPKVQEVTLGYCKVPKFKVETPIRHFREYENQIEEFELPYASLKSIKTGRYDVLSEVFKHSAHLSKLDTYMEEVSDCLFTLEKKTPNLKEIRLQDQYDGHHILRLPNLPLEHVEVSTYSKRIRRFHIVDTSMLQTWIVYGPIRRLNNPLSFPQLLELNLELEDAKSVERWSMPQLQHLYFTGKCCLNLAEQCPKVVHVKTRNVHVLANNCTCLQSLDVAFSNRLEIENVPLLEELTIRESLVSVRERNFANLKTCTLQVKNASALSLHEWQLPNLQVFSLQSDESCSITLNNCPNIVHISIAKVQLTVPKCPLLETFLASSCPSFCLNDTSALKKVYIYNTSAYPLASISGESLTNLEVFVSKRSDLKAFAQFRCLQSVFVCLEVDKNATNLEVFEMLQDILVHALEIPSFRIRITAQEFDIFVENAKPLFANLDSLKNGWKHALEQICHE